MKHTIWLYIRPFPSHLYFCWVIKIIPDHPIQNTNSFYHYPYHLPYLSGDPSTSFIIFLISSFLFLSILKFSNYLPFWNIEEGGVICCGSSTIQIFANPHKVMESKFHIYGEKLISPPHAYTCYIQRVISILTSPVACWHWTYGRI